MIVFDQPSAWSRYLAVCRENHQAVALVELELTSLVREGQSQCAVAEITGRLGNRAGTFDFIVKVLMALLEMGAIPELSFQVVSIDATTLQDTNQIRTAIRWAAAELGEAIAAESPTLLLAAPVNGIDQVDSRAAHRFQDLRTALRSLIAAAERRLVLVSPFWDREVAADLASLISRRLAAGVDVRIMARIPRSEADLDALTILTQAPGSRRPEVRLLERASPANRFGTSTFHFKAAIADSDFAYIGSANFNVAGLHSRWELGTLLRGGMARSVSELTDALFATAVPYAFNQ